MSSFRRYPQSSRIVVRLVQVTQKTEDPGPKKSFSLKEFDETFSMVTSVLTKVVVCILLFWLVVLPLLRPSPDRYIIEKPRVTQALADMGYDNTFVMQSLVSTIDEISTEARSKSDYREYISTNKRPEIKADVMGVGLSVDQISDYTTQLFGRKEKKIKSQLIKTETGVSLYLQVADLPVLKLRSANTDTELNVDTLLRKAAVAILKISDPTTLAYYYYRNKQFDQAVETAQLILKSEGHKDSKWAYNLLGKIHNERGKYHDAIRPLSRAIGIDPYFVSAWNNLGISCFNCARPEAKCPPDNWDSLALAAYRRCLRADTSAKYREVRYMLGKYWTRAGNCDSAVYYYRAALRIDSAYFLAWNNLAFAYNKKGETEAQYLDSAQQLLQRAIVHPALADSERRIIFTTLAETSFYKGDTVGFYDATRKAVALGFKFKGEHLNSKPYSYFKNDTTFQNIITPLRK